MCSSNAVLRYAVHRKLPVIHVQPWVCSSGVLHVSHAGLSKAAKALCKELLHKTGAASASKGQPAALAVSTSRDTDDNQYGANMNPGLSTHHLLRQSCCQCPQAWCVIASEESASCCPPLLVLPHYCNQQLCKHHGTCACSSPAHHMSTACR